jgi:hypothetical protein
LRAVLELYCSNSFLIGHFSADAPQKYIAVSAISLLKQFTTKSKKSFLAALLCSNHFMRGSGFTTSGCVWLLPLTVNRTV